MSRRKKQIWIVVLVVLLLLAVWIAWGNTALMVSEYTVSDSRIPNGFSGYKIAHISDLHNASFGDDNEKLLQLIAQSQPDAVVITGDLVDSRRTDIAVGINFAAQAALLAPTYYVPGNHESRIAQYNQLLAGLEDANVVVMMNDKLRLEQTDEYISLIGVKDPSFADVSGREGNLNWMKYILADLVDEDDGYTLLLSHRPELFDAYVQAGADLVFSGHLHGGQFRLPFIGGLVGPGQGLFPKYDAGMYTQQSTTMVVSRGLGNSIFPFRVNNRPELVIVELQQAQ